MGTPHSNYGRSAVADEQDQDLDSKSARSQGAAIAVCANRERKKKRPNSYAMRLSAIVLKSAVVFK